MINIDDVIKDQTQYAMIYLDIIERTNSSKQQGEFEREKYEYYTQMAKRYLI